MGKQPTANSTATPRGRSTRTRLLAATLEVVGKVGYAHATTKAIAAAAGVAEGTIYRHFPDKHELFLAAVIHGNAPVAEWMASLPARAGESSVEANLAETLTRLSMLRTQLLPLELATITDPALASRRQNLLRRGHSPESPAALPGPPALLAEYLAAEQRLGRVRADLDAVQTAVTILATLMGLALAPTLGPPIPDHGPRAGVDPRALATAASVLVRGISPRAENDEPQQRWSRQARPA